MMKKTAVALILSAGLLASYSAFAREVSVKITNLTNAIYFTPLLVAAHDRDTHLFQTGTPASPELQAMAEGGNTTGLIDQIEASGGSYVDNPAGGLLAPGAAAEATLDIHARQTGFLSLGAMLLPTNDGFVGLDALKIPKKSGTYTYYLQAYDAGTEANDEIITGGGAPNSPGIPADPGGNAGVGGIATVTADHNTAVHLHRGVVGDDDPASGPSDLDARVHRWQGPVAKLEITVPKGHHHDDDD